MDEPRPQLVAPMKVTYLGHATVVVESGAQVIITDPVFSNRIARVLTKRLTRLVFDPESARALAAVLISHAHHDHLDYRSLAKLGKGVPIIVPWGVSPFLHLRGFRDVRTVRPWGEVMVGETRIIAVPARHFGGRMPIPLGSGYQGYVVSGQRCLYFAGDTGLDRAMFRDIGRRFDIDLAILPIAGYVFPWYRAHHMNAEEALEAFRLLGARRMMPMHFETFPASLEPVAAPRNRLVAGAERLGVKDSLVVLGSREHFLLD